MNPCFRFLLSGATGLVTMSSFLAASETVGRDGQDGVAAATAVSQAVAPEVTQAPELPTRLRFGEEGWVSVGARLQPIFIYNDSDMLNDDAEFRLRRARIFVRGEATSWAGFSFATEVSGPNMLLIDAHFHFKPQDEAQAFVGRHLSPGTGRQAGTTSAASMMAIDRPAFAYKNLSYGGRAMTAFATSTLPGTNSGLRMDTQVRDEGVTFWGDHSRTEAIHLKYYLGVYDGWSKSPARGEGDLRYSGRAAINFGDDERGFYNSSTYLGKKQTIGLGVSFDAQNRVATDDVTGSDIDYLFWSIDFFAEQPVGPGVLNFEAGYGQLDLGDATGFLRDRDGAPLSAVSGQQAQGDGFYVQTGYYFPNLRLQPWVGYEEWYSDAPNDVGSFNNARIGVSYFARGHNLNFKIGYERTRLDWNRPGGRTSNTIVTGAYLTF